MEEDARRTIVKVCGLTRAEDARAALEAGADWLGFILWDESPRAVTPEQMRAIAAPLGEAVAVAVMVAPDPDQALRAAALAGADRIQLHRVDPATWPADFPLPVTFTVPVAQDGSLGAPLPALEHLVLLDTAHPRLPGGTGERFPWETARVVAATRPVLLSGGLDADCVAAAIERVEPFGVDASSRLERAPGIKDAEKMRRFVAAVRSWDERHSGRA
ncbi:MAG TPA: phosphoribosylanthranilate isomerase [Candidatus Eisenbacteria bacterium]|jgi:phosphoribosylanthranilate isomerase